MEIFSKNISTAGAICIAAALMLGTTALSSQPRAEMMIMPALDTSAPDTAQDTPAQDIPVDPSTIVKEMTGTIIDKTGAQIGTISAAIGKHGTMLDIAVSGLTPGKHGMHMHAVDQCDPDTGFKSAGGHIVSLDSYDPPSLAPGHGLLYADGPHAGDLPNLVVAADGTATTQVFSANLVWDMLADEDGAALIIHEGTDDHMTQPLGGSGGRVACGALSLPQ